MAIQGSVARRYAEALLGLARDDRAVGQFRESLDRLAQAFDKPTIASLEDPSVPLGRRKDAVGAATGDEPVEIRSLLLLLLERRRIALVPRIAGAFGDLVDRREGIAKARVTTAAPVGERERDDLVRRLEQSSGKKLRATFAVDPALIGGARVQIGDELVDSSLRARLDALGRQLAS